MAYRTPTVLTAYHFHTDRVRGSVLAVLHSLHNTSVLYSTALDQLGRDLITLIHI